MIRRQTGDAGKINELFKPLYMLITNHILWLIIYLFKYVVFSRHMDMSGSMYVCIRVYCVYISICYSATLIEILN